MNQISMSVFAERMASQGYDLTSVQFAALTALEASPGIDQATLAGMIAYDRVTIAGVVERLEQKGLIERTVNSRDRRSRLLKLSADGNRVLAQLMPVVRDLQDDILTGLDKSEKEALISLLEKATNAGNQNSRAPLTVRPSP
ncbi:winged helix-turn-helix transcriptional regulator [Ensifer sp. ENS08]|nr:MarR family winged helix-turn-helix transcriptional regulator [Ensifer sp. ENS08]MBD9570786.1 winged helix-turn-helix transcriptional regulator [Ensifer sp. ENS08]